MLPQFSAEKSLEPISGAYGTASKRVSALTLDNSVTPSQFIWWHVRPRVNGMGQACVDNCCSPTCPLIQVPNGTPVTARATPALGYSFKYWTWKDQYLSNQSQVAFDPKFGGTLVAYFG